MTSRGARLKSGRMTGNTYVFNTRISGGEPDQGERTIRAYAGPKAHAGGTVIEE